MELLQLTYFCEAAKTQNFSKTAKKYNVPPSNISQSVARLEKELDVTLFNRQANKIVLNGQGRIFFEHIQKALDEINEAKKIISEDETDVKGEVKVLICCNRRIVTKTIEKFKKLYPEVTFSFNHNPEAEESFDLIISDKVPDDKNVRKRLLIDEEILLAARKDNPILKNKPVTIKDLKNERFITMPKGSSLFDITEEVCRKNNFEPNIAIITDDPYYIRKYVEIGLGVAFIPAISWRGQWGDDAVCTRVGELRRKTYVYRFKDRYINKAGKLFEDMLVAVCENE